MTEDQPTITEPYLVTAVYADVVDVPQVYETEVQAVSVEDAERAAQDQCREDNGWDLDSDDPLIDLFARPVLPPVTTEWHGYPVSEAQHTTLTCLHALLQGSFSELRDHDVIIGKGHRRVLVTRDGTVHEA